MIYLRNRYYDPSTGRFINEDPIKDGLNWYVYANDNPIMSIDPWGLDSYVFVAAIMEEQADVRKEYYTEKYGTDSRKIVVSSAWQFVTEWNKLAESDEEIDAVEIISHGSITGKRGKDKNGTAYSTGYLYFTNDKGNNLYAREISGMKKGDYSVDDLNNLTAKELNINGCNSANKDTYNVAYGFMKNANITSYITGFDGGARWDGDVGDHVRGGGDFTFDLPWYTFGNPLFYVQKNQHTWYKYVDKNAVGVPLRQREGRRIVYDR